VISAPALGNALGHVDAAGQGAGVAPPPQLGAAPALIAETMARLWNSPALADVLTMRCQQILRHGHTPAADDALPLQTLPMLAAAQLHGAIEHAQFNKPGNARKYLVRAIALGLAALERIDRQVAAETEQDRP
jgi:hypothetical protein